MLGRIYAGWQKSPGSWHIRFNSTFIGETYQMNYVFMFELKSHLNVAADISLCWVEWSPQFICSPHPKKSRIRIRNMWWFAYRFNTPCYWHHGIDIQEIQLFSSPGGVWLDRVASEQCLGHRAFIQRMRIVLSEFWYTHKSCMVTTWRWGETYNSNLHLEARHQALW